MKAFAYAAPRYEDEVLGLLAGEWSGSEIIAGGTDLVPLMKKMLVTPDRVVNIKEVDSLRGIELDSFGARIGAITNLDEILDEPDLDGYSALKDAIRGIGSPQNQQQGTIGGELCHRPRCWYYRGGQGLLAKGGKLVFEGDNRFHAIFGNSGPAKFVHASRLAPSLIAHGATLRIIGPEADAETMLPLEQLYRAPRGEHQRETVLLPNQLITHVSLPLVEGILSATYEVHHGAGVEPPLAAASVAMRIELGVVREAKVVLGQVAPTPWISNDAAEALVGQVVSPESALAAGEAAVRRATPLSQNGYKVQLAKVSVQRAILRAAGFETGGF